MHTNEPRQDPLTDLGYETRDANFATLRKSFLWFVVFSIAMLATGYVLLATGIHIWFIRIDPMSPVYAGKQPQDAGIHVLPKSPNPLVQSNIATKVDIQELRQAEVKSLTTHGYANPEKTVATIPIDEAMQRVAAGENVSTGNVVAAVSKGNTTDQRKEAAPGVTTDVAPAPKPAPKTP